MEELTWRDCIESGIRAIVLNVLLPLLVAGVAATVFVAIGRHFVTEAEPVGPPKVQVSGPEGDSGL